MSPTKKKIMRKCFTRLKRKNNSKKKLTKMLYSNFSDLNEKIIAKKTNEKWQNLFFFHFNPEILAKLAFSFFTTDRSVFVLSVILLKAFSASFKVLS